ncbi:MAG TPA: hypothetical protein VHB21_19205, partial [Minicystis sp.]|nr:hypothetical protein [Minicystis sp.]
MAEKGTAHEGALGKTPIAHLLVYAMERQLTGVLFVAPVGAAAETAVRLARGVPVKVRSGDGYALLGRMLVEAGAISEKTLEDALSTKGLLGDVLLLAGCIDQRRLEDVALQQFVRRVVHLFELGPEARFRYEDGSVELLDWGGEAANVDPLYLLWQGVRAHGSSALEPMLAAFAATPLRLHAAAPVGRFGFDDDERMLVDHLAATAASVDELAAFDLVPAERVRRLDYLLAITRALDLGAAGTLPVGVAARTASA